MEQDALDLKMPKIMSKLDGNSKQQLKKDAQMLLKSSKQPIHVTNYGKKESLAYLMTRMPFSLAAMDQIMLQLKKRIPEYQPVSILDFGTGPGTALISAKNTYPESLQSAVGVDTSSEMLDFAKMFINGPDKPLASFDSLLFKRQLAKHEPQYDLVVGSHILEHVASKEAFRETLQALWDATADSGLLVLVDRGNPNGSDLIQKARAWLIQKCEKTEQDFHIVAPCAHEKTCPMEKNRSWCHFSQRLRINPTTVSPFSPFLNSF
jgi:ribosomal protein RSM22 (predicted rRNA methylase)